MMNQKSNVSAKAENPEDVYCSWSCTSPRPKI